MTRTLIEAGVDVIKVVNAGNGTVDQITAIVEEAHAHNLRVTAHGRSDAEIRISLAAGVDELQHIGTDSAEYSADIIASIRERMKSGPLYWSPTVGPQLNASRLAKDREFLDDPANFVGLPSAIEEDVRAAISSADIEAPDPSVEAIVKHKIDQLRELGVVFISGSDEGTFGQASASATWQDLDVWVRELGMEPMDAIKWVTADAARFMGAIDETGTVTQGKYADTIAVRGSPLTDISSLRAPVIVIRHGKRYK